MKKSERYIKEYAPRFGLSHYRYTVTLLPEEWKGKIWGRSHFNHEDEFFDIQVVPDGTLAETPHRHLILHELAHGLLGYVNDHQSCETACNRIAKLVLGPEADGPNYQQCGGPNGEWPTPETDESAVENRPLRRADSERTAPEYAIAYSRRTFMSDDGKELVVDKLLDGLGSLTDRERFVLGSLFIDGLSYRAVARLMGVSARTIQRLRASAVRKLSEVV